MEAIDPNIFQLTIFILSILVGYYVGYIPDIVPANGKAYWVYIAAPILGAGSGLVMYGALFEERD